jgi:type I restriction enzyme S subunit
LIRSLEVVVPPLPEQRAIAEVLGALDDKIEANRRTQEITEGLARARVAKAQEESDSVLPIGSIVERVSDIVQPGDIPDEAAYVGLEHMPQGSILLKEHGRPAGLASAKAKFRSRDVLFGKLRPYFKKVAIAPGVGVCSTDILVLRPKADDWAVAAAVCASDEVIDYASAGSEGTRMPRVSWDYLSRFEVPVPDPDRRQALQAQVSPLLELGISLTVESDRLAAVRDALLPRLLSGELRVRDAESIVGEAV